MATGAHSTKRNSVRSWVAHFLRATARRIEAWGERSHGDDPDDNQLARLREKYPGAPEHWIRLAAQARVPVKQKVVKRRERFEAPSQSTRAARLHVEPHTKWPHTQRESPVFESNSWSDDPGERQFTKAMNAAPTAKKRDNQFALSPECQRAVSDQHFAMPPSRQRPDDVPPVFEKRNARKPTAPRFLLPSNERVRSNIELALPHHSETGKARIKLSFVAAPPPASFRQPMNNLESTAPETGNASLNETAPIPTLSSTVPSYREIKRVRVLEKTRLATPTNTHAPPPRKSPIEDFATVTPLVEMAPSPVSAEFNPQEPKWPSLPKPLTKLSDDNALATMPEFDQLENVALWNALPF